MLHVLCRIGRDSYAISSEAVERVLPFASLKTLPGAARGLCGILNYQGLAVPVVDLCLVLSGMPAREFMNTRILLCPLEASPSGKLGLLVENVSETAKLDERDFQPAGAEGIECLDALAASGGSFIQRIEVPRILPPDLLKALDLPVTYSA